jgi:hypothetical protein
VPASMAGGGQSTGAAVAARARGRRVDAIYRRASVCGSKPSRRRDALASMPQYGSASTGAPVAGRAQDRLAGRRRGCPDVEGKHDAWQGRRYAGRDAQTGGRGPASCTYGGVGRRGAARGRAGARERDSTSRSGVAQFGLPWFD